MKNNKKKYPYNDNIDIEECVFIRNYKYNEKDFMDQKIQKCSEYTYIPSSKNIGVAAVNPVLPDGNVIAWNPEPEANEISTYLGA